MIKKWGPLSTLLTTKSTYTLLSPLIHSSLNIITLPFLFMAFYDLNIKQSLLKEYKKEIEESEFCGFCVSDYSGEPENIKKRIYKRAELVISDSHQLQNINPKTITRMDLFCIKLEKYINFDKVLAISPDLITFDFTSEMIKFKHKHIRSAIKQGIFFEITIRPSLYKQEERILWIRNVKELLKITKGRNTIISSGATRNTEMKRPVDLVKLFNFFGLSDDRGFKVLENSEELLRKCALKRFAYKNVIVNNVDEGNLKEDFLINYF